MIDPEQRRVAIQKLWTYLVIAIGCIVAGPIAYYALQGLVAIVAFVAAVGLVTNFAPAIALWIANKKVQALIAAIEANPIETMQNLLIEKNDEFNVQDAAIRDFDTEFRNVNNLVDDLKRTDPDEAEQYVEMRDKMKEGLVELRSEQSAAAKELKNFSFQIDKARRIWKVAQAMNTALEKSQSAQAKVFADIKKQVAFDTVRTNLNRAFANLNSAVERRKSASVFQAEPKQIDAPKVEVVDVTAQRRAIGVSRER